MANVCRLDNIVVPLSVYTCFMPFQMVCFVRKVSLNHLSDWWNFSNNQSETFIGTIFKAYTLRSFAIIGSFHAKGLEKSSSGNVVKSCVHFCFESLLDLENAKKYEITDFSYIVTTKNQSLLRTFYISQIMYCTDFFGTECVIDGRLIKIFKEDLN